jgi:hypothetical protein
MFEHLLDFNIENENTYLKVDNILEYATSIDDNDAIQIIKKANKKKQIIKANNKSK